MYIHILINIIYACLAPTLHFRFSQLSSTRPITKENNKKKEKKKQNPIHQLQHNLYKQHNNSSNNNNSYYNIIRHRLRLRAAYKTATATTEQLSLSLSHTHAGSMNHFRFRQQHGRHYMQKEEELNGGLAKVNERVSVCVRLCELFLFIFCCCIFICIYIACFHNRYGRRGISCTIFRACA